MGEDCEEGRKEVSKQPEVEGDKFLDKGHSENILLCAGNGFLVPCCCYDITYIDNNESFCIMTNKQVHRYTCHQFSVQSHLLDCKFCLSVKEAHL